VIAPTPQIPNTTLSRPSAAATCQPLHLRPNFVERLLHVLQLAEEKCATAKGLP
jgi:hypothetical protein